MGLINLGKEGTGWCWCIKSICLELFWWVLMMGHLFSLRLRWCTTWVKTLNYHLQFNVCFSNGQWFFSLVRIWLFTKWSWIKPYFCHLFSTVLACYGRFLVKDYFCLLSCIRLAPDENAKHIETRLASAVLLICLLLVLFPARVTFFCFFGSIISIAYYTIFLTLDWC